MNNKMFEIEKYLIEKDTALRADNECISDGGIMRVCPDVIDLEVIGNIYENPELLEI